ncbi:MAG: hypothetical protein LW855_03420 [Alphaproteobacteria bacterium]|jgi:hypothetical protein|nr:hypothetical protein [Thalassospira sp.]MCE2964823.1 hypothetical protein [Alphaproteobacteria bacterium]
MKQILLLVLFFVLAGVVGVVAYSWNAAPEQQQLTTELPVHSSRNP